jgi:hypothetical protein
MARRANQSLGQKIGQEKQRPEKKRAEFQFGPLIDRVTQG